MKVQRFSIVYSPVNKKYTIMQKFYFVRYEFGSVIAETPELASDAIAGFEYSPLDNKVLVVVSPKANAQIFPDLSHKEVMQRIIYLQLAIIWTVNDFETKAQELERAQGKWIYNRKKFEDALSLMIQNHDRNKGITWQTVAEYLNGHCK